MLAAALSLAIFATFLIVGFAAVSLANRNRSLLLNVLIAPAVGATVLLTPTMILSQAGLPVDAFGKYLVPLCILVAVGVLAWKRPVVPWKRLWPFAVILLGLFAIVGRPFLDFGFNWVSFSNDDMLNYCLAADRFAHQAFFHMPPVRPDEIFRGYNTTYWFEYVVGGERSGVELLLGLVLSVTGLRGFQAFMPFIVAGNLALVMSSAALLARRSSRPIGTYFAAVLMAASGLTVLGTMYQLLGQVYGLLLLTAAVAFLGREETLAPFTRRSAPRVILGAILLTGQVLIYPELLAFVVAGFGIYSGLLVLRKRWSLRAAAWPALAALVITIILAGRNFLTMTLLILQRVTSTIPSGSHAAAIDLRFPYYLIPSGFANLWGLFALPGLPSDPWLSIAIGVGAFLTAIVAVAAVKYSWEEAGPAIVAALMMGLAALLFIKRSDFGLYKIAMYMQPFILGTMAMLLVRLRWRKLAVVAIFLLVAANVATSWHYVDVSRNLPGSPASGFVEVAHASPTHLIAQLARITLPSSVDAVLSDAPIVSLAKYETGYVGDLPIFFLTRDFRNHGIPPWPFPVLKKQHEEIFARAGRLIDLAKTFEQKRYMNFGNAKHNNYAWFLAPIMPAILKGDPVVIESTSQESILNRTTDFDSANDFRVLDLNQVHNHVSFVESSLGYAPGAQQVEKVSLYQLEPDYFKPNKTMSAMGRYLLLNILRPSKKVRLVLSVTDSLAADGANKLPPITAIGQTRVSFHVVGRGSAHLVSDPVAPKNIDGASYVGIDMGIPGRRFPTMRTGLMSLFGTAIPLDPRVITVFGRNLSAISEADYDRWRAPGSVSKFPDDLFNPTVVYSGFYEDGWISEEARITLSDSQSDSIFVVSGVVPRIHNDGFTTTMKVTVDGKILGSLYLGVGTFNAAFPCRLPSGKHVVRIRFSAVQALPAPDNRMAAAKIQWIGFRAAQ